MDGLVVGVEHIRAEALLSTEQSPAKLRSRSLHSPFHSGRLSVQRPGSSLGRSLPFKRWTWRIMRAVVLRVTILSLHGRLAFFLAWNTRFLSSMTTDNVTLLRGQNSTTHGSQNVLVDRSTFVQPSGSFTDQGGVLWENVDCHEIPISPSGQEREEKGCRYVRRGSTPRTRATLNLVRRAQNKGLPTIPIQKPHIGWMLERYDRKSALFGASSQREGCDQTTQLKISL